MFRTTDIVLIAVMVSAAAFTYATKHEAEDKLSEIRRIERQIKLEEDTLTVLKADWSLLTQPSRLQRLTEIYAGELALQPMEPHSIVGLDDLPLKPLQLDESASDQLGGMAGVDTETVTGGVVQ